MRESQRTAGDRDVRSENFAAELTSAVYPLVLRRGLKESWLKVELDLWKALAETVREWVDRRPTDASSDAIVGWQEGLLGALTASARTLALKNGVNGPRREMESGLDEAFRRVLGRCIHVN
jgi:hypothetical protein